MADNRLIKRIVDIYALVLIVVLPLFMVHVYADINTAKIYLYSYSTLACLILLMLIEAYRLIKNKEERVRLKSVFKSGSLRELVKKLSVPDYFMLAFLFFTILSTVLSEWRFEAFWGNLGRYQGCYIWILYVVTYFILTRFYTPRRSHIDIMLTVGDIMSLWALSDYLMINPVTLDNDGGIFMTTIGNVNLVTAILALYLAVASVMFVGEGNKGLSIPRSLFYFISIIILFAGAECARSANFLISAGFLVCFIPFYAFRKRESSVRYLMMLFAYLAGMIIISWINNNFPVINKSSELIYFGEKYISRIKVAALVLLTVSLALFVFLRLRAARRPGEEADEYGRTPADKKTGTVLRSIWAVCGVAAAVIAVLILYDANTGGHPEFYEPYKNYLILDNEFWGNGRGYIWDLCFKYMGMFSLREKLLGSGPETFSVFQLIYDYRAGLKRSNQIYDVPHNEWLQHLFETGILGFISYYGLIASVCVKGFLAPKANEKKGGWYSGQAAYDYRMIGTALSFAVLTYTAQSVVNIVTPINTNIFIVFLCVCAACGRKRPDG